MQPRICNQKNGQCYEIPFVIIKGDYVPLLGAQASQQMHLLTVEYDNIDEPTQSDCFNCSSVFPQHSATEQPSASSKPTLNATTNQRTSLTKDQIMQNFGDVLKVWVKCQEHYT